MVKEVPISQGRIALVDDEDFEAVMRFRWQVFRAERKQGPDVLYARRKNRENDGDRRYPVMHRMILPGFAMIDHKDGNGLNNQKSNLRPATNSQNQANRSTHKPGETSHFRGVYLHRKTMKWNAHIRANGKMINLGYFVDEIAAAKAYDEAAVHFFGEFARPNFPKASAA